MPQYEQFGDRDVPFFGDYNYIAASGSTVLLTWPDERDAVPGIDPRYTNGDGTDGFDVLQCRAANPDGTFGPDTCPNDGGLDQNIYGASESGGDPPQVFHEMLVLAAPAFLVSRSEDRRGMHGCGDIGGEVGVNEFTTLFRNLE